MISRLTYYLSSIPTLLLGIVNWWALPLLLLGKRPFRLQLRSGLQFYVRTLMDVWIIKETCLDNDYERVGTPLQDGWHIIDIGAGLGDFTVYAAAKCPNSTVLAFEPFPESFALLQENLVLNGITHVRPFPAAVSAKTGELKLATTGAAVQHTTSQTAVSQAALTVPAISLADIFRQNHLQQCDFLKMDCEGGEFDILLNTPDNTLRKIRRICLEYHDDRTPYQHTELVDRLQMLGFVVETAVNPAHTELGFIYAALNEND